MIIHHINAFCMFFYFLSSCGRLHKGQQNYQFVKIIDLQPPTHVNLKCAADRPPKRRPQQHCGPDSTKDIPGEIVCYIIKTTRQEKSLSEKCGTL